MGDFATAVREARTSKNWSQRFTAERCAVTQQYLCLIEGGSRTPSLPVYGRIVRALDLDPRIGLS